MAPKQATSEMDILEPSYESHNTHRSRKYMF